jgi:hypothetical protein
MKREIYLSGLGQFATVVLLMVTSIGSPLTAPIKHTIPQRRIQSAREAPAPHEAIRRPTIFPQIISYSNVHKRMMPGFTPTMTVKRVYFHTLTAMLPITAPAKFLEDFFSSIALKADPIKGAWGSQLPQRDSLDITQGNFRLRFASIGDTIPWSFVKDFADKLWECAVMGVANLFETAYTNEGATVGVQISLTVLDQSSVASGSGSGSGQGYREGSWESITSPGGGS